MDNIRYLAASVFVQHPNETDWIAKLAKRAHIGEETVRRMVKGIGSPRLDNVESVATALGVSLTDLLGTQLRSQGAPTSTTDPPVVDEGSLQRHRRKAVTTHR
jgi:transcriptional regulator with XRE-family HTH domain